MKLTTDQLKEFDETGYLFMPGMFSPKEAEVLAAEAKVVYASNEKKCGVKSRPSALSLRLAFDDEILIG
ncbi:MAG: hypothetical protein ACI9UN_002917 [Granulosicoccus sp.]|jgi:hypothetical protein